MSNVRRVYVEKKPAFAVRARELEAEIRNYLGISDVKGVRELIRYDMEHVSEETYRKALVTVFSEPPVDDVYEETFELNGARTFSVEFLPGQFDQRADSAEQCVKLLNENEEPLIRTAVTYVIEGEISDTEFEAIKKHCINPVDSRETGLEKPQTLVQTFPEPEDVKIFDGFSAMSEAELKELYDSLGLAMTFKDFLHIQNYFKKTAQLLKKFAEDFVCISSDVWKSRSFEQLKSENALFYQDILPQNYGHSFADPAFAVQELGEEFGRILSFLYTELRSERAFVFEQNLEKITILNELFLEIYCMFEEGDVTYKQIKDTIYWFLYDYADDWAGYRVRELVDPALDFATSIIMDSDLSDLTYLYSYGDYISEVEIETAKFLNSLTEEEISQIAETFTEGYRRGFELKGVDVSKKDTVNIRYPIGFERVIRAAIRQFADMGLKPVIYREALNTLNKRQNLRIGYISTDPNPQYGYDHRFDNAIYLDKRMIDRKLSCMRKAYEEYENRKSSYLKNKPNGKTKDK